jgi:CBS domain containing-hemolysin-like protein
VTGHAVSIAVIAVLFAFSAVLALAETAFVRVSRIRLLNLEEEGDKRAERVLRMLEHPEQTMNTVLLMLLACQMVSATLLGTVLEPSFGTAGVVAGMVIEIFVVFTFAEVAPKTFAVQHAERAVMSVSGLLSFLTYFAPLRLLTRGFIGVANIVLPGKGLRGGPFVTEEEILTMADVAAQEASIETGERELIHSIFEFGDTVVREVMQPRPDMRVVDADDTIESAIAAAIDGGFSRIPACEGTSDHILGLVYLKDLVRRARDGEGGQPVRTAVRPATFVPEQKRVAELLREMQTQQFHMAIVIDEYGDTAGLVTLEDLLEEIVGEIADEYDVEQPTVEHLPDGSLRVAGRTPIDEVSEELGAELPDTEWDTVGGLVLNLLGHVPEEGESVRFLEFELTAERVQQRRIGSVLIRRLASAGTADSADPTDDASVADASSQ